MRKPAIPPVPIGEPARSNFDSSVKEVLESLTGQRNGRLELLDTDATTEQMRLKINELVARLNFQ